METTTHRTTLSFDGCGINGPDEYRSRLATFTNSERAAQWGPLMAAAPELLEALRECITDHGSRAWQAGDPGSLCRRLDAISELARNAIAKAEGRS